MRIVLYLCTIKFKNNNIMSHTKNITIGTVKILVWEELNAIHIGKSPVNQKNPTAKDFEDCKNLDLLSTKIAQKYINDPKCRPAFDYKVEDNRYNLLFFLY